MTSLVEYFRYQGAQLSSFDSADTAPLVSLINAAYSYQDAAKGEPRINAEKLHKRTTQSEFYVIKHSGTIIGCVYTEQKGTALHFGLLTLSKDYRGSGLAPAIIRGIEAYAGARGCASVQLDYMSLAPWLRAYYEKFGFTETGEVTEWGSINLIQMSKPLGLVRG